MFSEVGLEPGLKLLSSSSKTLAFRKPKQATPPPATPAPAAGTGIGAASSPQTAGEEQAEKIGFVVAS